MKSAISFITMVPPPQERDRPHRHGAAVCPAPSIVTCTTTTSHRFETICAEPYSTRSTSVLRLRGCGRSRRQACYPPRRRWLTSNGGNMLGGLILGSILLLQNTATPRTVRYEANINT